MKTRPSTRRALKNQLEDVEALFRSVTRSEAAVVGLVRRKVLCRNPDQARIALQVMNDDLDALLGTMDLRVRDAYRNGRRGEVMAAIRRTRRKCHAVIRDVINAICEIDKETL